MKGGRRAEFTFVTTALLDVIDNGHRRRSLTIALKCLQKGDYPWGERSVQGEKVCASMAVEQRVGNGKVGSGRCWG
jgi:hypothetical protein